MEVLNNSLLKYTFTTHAVPADEPVGIIEINRAPRIGDLIAAEVLSIGQHTKYEDRNGAVMSLYENDLIIGAFGNRYATDQFEGYVPEIISEECDMLSIGGVFGEVRSKHAVMKEPTRLKILGAVCDFGGNALNLTDFGLKPDAKFNRFSMRRQTEIILVIGSSMNSGKTTTAGTLVRALTKGGFRVSAAKITGTAAGKDGRFFKSCGAQKVLDFTDAGYPSTYMLGMKELLAIYESLLSNLSATNPDYIVLEIADGIFQRETRALLENPIFTASIDHLFFSANDSLSAECGVRYLREMRLPLRALTGVFTQSPLAMREAKEKTKVPCFSIEQMMSGLVAENLRRSKPLLQVA